LDPHCALSEIESKQALQRQCAEKGQIDAVLVIPIQTEVWDSPERKHKQAIKNYLQVLLDQVLC
jgi:hypothetical protein